MITLALQSSEEKSLDELGLSSEDVEVLTAVADVAKVFTTSLGLGAETLEQARCALGYEAWLGYWTKSLSSVPKIGLVIIALIGFLLSQLSNMAV